MTSQNNLKSHALPNKSGEKQYWADLAGSSLALALANAAKQAPGLALIVTADSHSAQTLSEELAFFLADCTIPLHYFPDWETLPYDHFSPHQDIISQRLATLAQLPHTQQGILLVPITTLMQRLVPTDYVGQFSLLLNTGDHIDLAAFRQRLEHQGYLCVSQVMEHGEFAIRGSLIDIFPMGSPTPYRIDLFDDVCDSIRLFDPSTQRSADTINTINVLPAKEYALTEHTIARFRQQWRQHFSGKPTEAPVYTHVSEGQSIGGIEYYLPLFYEHMATLFDYLPTNTLVISDSKVQAAGEHYWQDINKRYEQRRYDHSRPLLAPDQLFLSMDSINHTLKTRARIIVNTQHKHQKIILNTRALPNLSIDNQAKQPLNRLTLFLKEHADQRILFCAESNGRREVLLELLQSLSLQPHTLATWSDFLSSSVQYAITVAPLQRGVHMLDDAIILITETELFGEQVLQQRRRVSRDVQLDTIVKNLAELQSGSPVVHIDHGVGRYVGLQTFTIEQVPTEFLTLEYANEATLYVPVSSLHLISRYTGSDTEHAPLHRLGSSAWEKSKQQAAKKIRDAAAELLAIYAKRAAKPGHHFAEPDKDYQQFVANFPFEETPDQQKAIDDVINDMTSDNCMDRLVCGDVGFGKTEVAMRAAFLAVQDGQQVAILVPTTLLAQQHYENFCDRFADWPIKIAVLSRFRSAKQQQQTIADSNAGKVDILIGTHRLLTAQLPFKQLGLLVIDEEHRFGVRQKEKLKSMRAHVDILTLTATPIPRTLNMALSGTRDLSIIATPPAKRLAIKTFVHTKDDIIIQEAVQREILRGGQVFFLHNNVESIQHMAEELQALLPDIRIAVAHGQMRERELEKIMSDFYHQKYHVLVCTTIIENGIDIPSANTIIMNRADKLGLSQLHQLRGRVGRSHHQAYAYLLIPGEKIITKDAEKRLDAVMSLGDLGIGFTLATHDLEIRGAGELLGEDQSGNMEAIGFSLYMELLEKAVADLKAGRTLSQDLISSHTTEIDLHIAALIPEDYLPDVHLRLVLYKRIASAKSKAALKDIQVEMIDRFGLLPTAVQSLFAITELKLLAEPLDIKKIDVSNAGGKITFHPHTTVKPETIIQLIQQQPKTFKLMGSHSLRFIHTTHNIGERIHYIEELLRKL